MCCARLSEREKFLLQVRHLNGFSPVWRDRMWRFKCSLLRKRFSQPRISHTKALMISPERRVFLRSCLVFVDASESSSVFRGGEKRPRNGAWLLWLSMCLATMRLAIISSQSGEDNISLSFCAVGTRPESVSHHSMPKCVFLASFGLCPGISAGDDTPTTRSWLDSWSVFRVRVILCGTLGFWFTI